MKNGCHALSLLGSPILVEELPTKTRVACGDRLQRCFMPRTPATTQRFVWMQSELQFFASRSRSNRLPQHRYWSSEARSQANTSCAMALKRKYGSPPQSSAESSFEIMRMLKYRPRSHFSSCSGSPHYSMNTVKERNTTQHQRLNRMTTLTMSAIFICLLASWSSPAAAFHSSGPVTFGSRQSGTALFVVEPKERTETLRSRTDDLPFDASTGNTLVENLVMNSSAEEEVTQSNEEESSEDSSQENEAKYEDDEAKAERLANAAKAAAFLARRNGSKSAGKVATTKATSVGARRIGSASQARAGARSMTQLTDAVKKAASANTAPQKKDTPEASTMKVSHLANVSKSVIQATVESMIQTSASMGLFGEVEHGPSLPEPFLHQAPLPGTVLMQAERSTKPWRAADRISVRVASMVDDLDIANLRLSVFSDFSPDMRRAFCAKSCQVLSSRRNRGATCIVATVPRYGSIMSPRPDIILGTAECSFHEFEGTSLGRQRQADSILYITEVAVSPTARRKGIGRKIMESIDQLANIRGVETIFLHVDVNNHGALSLYARSGYARVPPNDPRFEEFTRSLNLHDGATKGRNHYLLHKNLLQPTWFPGRKIESQLGTLGFEITA